MIGLRLVGNASCLLAQQIELWSSIWIQNTDEKYREKKNFITVKIELGQIIRSSAFKV